MVEFDNILSEINRVTPTQWKQLAMVQLPCMMISMHMAAMVFLGAPVDYECAIPQQKVLEQECRNNWTDAQTSLFVPTDNSGEFDKCKRYDYEYTGQNITTPCDYCWPNGTNDVQLVSPAPNTTQCNNWWYNTTVFKSTVITEFDLVCGQNYKRRLSQAIFMTGVTLGCLTWGQFSDRRGRKLAIAIPSLIGLIFALSAAFAKSFMVFTGLRFFVGFCTFPPFPNTFVLGTELMAPKYRVWVGTSAQSIFALGFCLLALLGYFIRYWRMLQIAISLPLVLLLIQYWFIFESARWLISTHQYRKAYEIVKKLIGKENKRMEESEKMYTSELKKLERLAGGQSPEKKSEDEQIALNNGTQLKTYNLIDLLRTPNIRKRSVILFYLWCCVSAMYYGLTLNAADLGGNPFINLFLSGFVEIPACFLSVIVLQKLGRVPTLSMTFGLGGISCIAMLFVSKNMLGLNIFLSMFGKLCSTAAFSAVYIYAAEVYPTPIRNIGIGVCGSWARIGGILAPFIAMLDVLAKPLPYVVFGLLSILAAILVLFLPETLGISLPETIEEGEEFGSHGGSFIRKCCMESRHLHEEDTMVNFDDVRERDANENELKHSRI